MTTELELIPPPPCPGSMVRSSTLCIAADYEELSRTAAARIASSLGRFRSRNRGKPVTVVFSAGRTPACTYEILASDYRSVIDWQAVQLFQMDEYVDLAGFEEDFRQYLQNRIVRPLGIRIANVLDRRLIGNSHDDWRLAIRDHERLLLAADGIDLVVHGIGTNGHLGFNEPGSDPGSAGRVVDLASSTRESVAASIAPKHGVTLGLAVLLAAKESILLASGIDKAKAVARAMDGPVGTDCPASWLRHTRELTIIVDLTAASQLDNLDCHGSKSQTRGSSSVIGDATSGANV